MKITNICFLLTLCLALAACTAEENAGGELSAADEAKAAELLGSYESARAGKNWEAAESTAEKLRVKYPDSAAAAKLAPSIEQVSSEAELVRESRRLAQLWDYQEIAVGKGVQRSATVYSFTAPAEEGVPAAMPDAQLVLRDHPSWGRSVYLLLAQSKFDCGKPCVMKISFDDAPAQDFSGKQADSGKGPALFIEDKARFLPAMTGAKKVRIELPKGSGRIPALVFEVGGYAPERFEKP